MLGLKAMDAFRLRMLGCFQIYQLEHWCSFIEQKHLLQFLSSNKLKTSSNFDLQMNVLVFLFDLQYLLKIIINHNVESVQSQSCIASTITTKLIHETIIELFVGYSGSRLSQAPEFKASCPIRLLPFHS